MRKSQIISAIAAAVATPGLLIAFAAPASALASASLSPANCGVHGNQTCLGLAQDVPGVGSSGTDVQVSCTALGTAAVQATIVRCYIRGNNGDVHYTPSVLTQGRASTLTHTFDSWYLTSRTYTVCVGAGYYSTSGNHYAAGGYVCGSAV